VGGGQERGSRRGGRRVGTNRRLADLRDTEKNRIKEE